MQKEIKKRQFEKNIIHIKLKVGDLTEQEEHQTKVMMIKNCIFNK